MSFRKWEIMKRKVFISLLTIVLFIVLCFFIKPIKPQSNTENIIQQPEAIVEIVEAKEYPKEPVIEYKKETIYTTTILNMRDAASLNGKVVKVLPMNTKLTKIGKEGNWTKVLVGDKIYYVYSKYTSAKKTVVKKQSSKTTTQKKTKAVKKTTTATASHSKGEYQNYAHDLVINKYGWTEYDFECLVKLWNRESGWNPNAHNKKSGAHGIPQSLPAKKMASEGSDYYTNGFTQIRWGLKYIKGRYGSPSQAWAHSQAKGWY